jgi:hypothetical protein
MARMSGAQVQGSLHMQQKMVSLGAFRQRRYAERQERGEIIVSIRINQDNVADRLVAAGFLDERERYDRRAIEAALQRVIDLQFPDASLDTV